MTIDRKNRVFIGGITENIRKDEIEKEFEKYGKLTSVWVAQNPPGFAFVEYERESDADDAVRQMNGSSIPGTSGKLRVEHSRGRSRGGGGGRGGGGRGGGGFSRDRFGDRGGGGSSRGGRDFGSRGGGFSSRGGSSFGGRGGPYGSRGDRRGGGGGGSGGRFDRGSRGGGGGGGRDRFDSHSYGGSSGGHDYKSSSGSYPNYRSRSPLSQGRSRQGFGARDYSPSGGGNSYSSGGNSYMSGGNSAY